MKTLILLEIESKDVPDLLDKVTGRVYTLSGVEDVEGKIVWQERDKEHVATD